MTDPQDERFIDLECRVADLERIVEKLVEAVKELKEVKP